MSQDKLIKNGKAQKMVTDQVYTEQKPVGKKRKEIYVYNKISNGQHHIGLHASQVVLYVVDRTNNVLTAQAVNRRSISSAKKLIQD